MEQRRMEGGYLKLEVMRKALEPVVHERMSQGTGEKILKEKKKVSGWSMEEMRERPNIAVEVDTEEMRKWRGLSQSEMDLHWKNLAERTEEEVLNKYEDEESKKEAFRGRGALLEWRRVRKSKKYRIRMWREDCWARIFSLLREYNLQRQQSKQEELTDKENQIKRKSGR